VALLELRSMMLRGCSILNGVARVGSGSAFAGFDPAAGVQLEPAYRSASTEDVELAAKLADEAFAVYGKLSGKEKGRFLREIAAGIDSAAAELVARARAETALPEARLKGEAARTANQIRMFAQVVEEGSWVMARIDPALPDRTPLPRADIRSMLRPVGPVAVFGASNFPLAFSVAGGDTASALAAGCPVIVKAHAAHPGSCELMGQIVSQSVKACGLPTGTFALLFDAGIEVGSALVQNSKIKAVGFTGSLRGGKALMDLAARRAEPIPCYMEMGSTNPVFVLSEALRSRGAEIASGLFASFTLGVGQMCTKPGLVFLPQDEDGDSLVAALAANVVQSTGATMLTPGIAKNYAAGIVSRCGHAGVETLAMGGSTSGDGFAAGIAALLQVSGADLLTHRELGEEVFGPGTLVVRYADRQELITLAAALEGQLTASVHGSGADLAGFADLMDILERKAGRLIVNGFPTGVEVCDAMVHGGPFPATSDSRTTSVGSQAIFRFARPVCYQDFPQACLPDELNNENPLGIWRMINGTMTRDAV
jgi:alpha-ketoglutaric semialdehyde dehydrogenase